jgi:hypothetical protein
MSARVSGALARDDPIRRRGDGVVWKAMVPPHPGIPSLDGHTDTVPDIVGRLGAPIDLAIFTEGNHFPALLGGEIIEPFRVWARAQPQYAGLELGNIVVVTLPQPMIVGMLLSGGIALGNLTLEVSRASGFIRTSSWAAPHRSRNCIAPRSSGARPACSPAIVGFH